MYITRLTTLFRSGADVQELADEKKAEKILGPVVNPSDNLENLFELPVLFFAAMFSLALAGFADGADSNLAWAFVGFRALHSLIHCSSNRIKHRFAAYLFSSIALWALWARIAYRLLST